MMVKRGDPDSVVWRETRGRHADPTDVVAHAVDKDKTLCGEPSKVAPWADTGRGQRCDKCMRAVTATPLGSDEITVAVGVSYRQLDSWTRQGLVQSLGDPQPGSGNRRRWSAEEVSVVAAMHVLVNEAGLTPEAASRAARNNGVLTTGVVVRVNRPDITLAGPSLLKISPATEQQAAGEQAVEEIELKTQTRPALDVEEVQ